MFLQEAKLITLTCQPVIQVESDANQVPIRLRDRGKPVYHLPLLYSHNIGPTSGGSDPGQI